ncbi:MAG: sigma-70 family RNA polymerase sigma factor [Pirellulales bacterium]
MITTNNSWQSTFSQLIDYVESCEFEGSSESLSTDVDLLLEEIGKLRCTPQRGKELYSHGMGDLPVLSRHEEERCFRGMNFLKYQIRQFQIALLRRHSKTKAALISKLQDQVKTIRDYLIYSNLRLVISLVKKYVSTQLGFDELYSEGVVTLMQAVEKFNYQKGFRFSTYAYRSISRALYNMQIDLQQDQAVVALDNDNRVESAAQPDRTSAVSESWWSAKKECLTKLVLRLDRREQLIVRARYALTPRGTIKTFQTLANKLGISKERVRQLEQRAIQKLQSMASEVEMV